jgi:hypothetical protein
MNPDGGEAAGKYARISVVVPDDTARDTDPTLTAVGVEGKLEPKMVRTLVV